MQPTNILTFLAVSTFSFTELPSVQFSPCTSSTYWVYRCWTWLFFFPQWKIGFLIRGKCLFSLKIVITFFPLVTKLIWDSFTWMSFFFFFFPFFPKACMGEKCVRASENCSTCMFWIKSWISWKGWDKDSSKIWKIKLNIQVCLYLVNVSLPEEGTSRSSCAVYVWLFHLPHTQWPTLMLPQISFCFRGGIHQLEYAEQWNHFTYF